MSVVSHWHPQTARHFALAGLASFAVGFAMVRWLERGALTFLEVNGVETHSASSQLHSAMIVIAERSPTRQGLPELPRRLLSAP